MVEKKLNMKPRIFVLCGVYNNLSYTKKLLACLRKQTYSPYQILIVDDGSTDKTAQYLSKQSEVITLKGDGNLWWTGAMCLGIEKIMETCRSGDFVLILNNDCVFDDHYIKTLLSIGLRHNKAIVGSVALDTKDHDRIWDGGVKIDWEKGRFIGMGPKYLSELPRDVGENTQIDTITTKGTLYPADVFREIGNFDKKHLPHYLSDYEFGCRAKRSGYKLILSYAARVYNDIERTGMGDGSHKRSITLREFKATLFARRSRVNIVDHWQFIKLVCPPQYKLRNYYFLVLKFLYHLTFVSPFYVIRPLINKFNTHRA